MTDDEADMYYDKWLVAKTTIKRLTEGPGGIMEMKQTIADKEAEIEELKRINVNANKFNETIAASVLNKFYYEHQIEKLKLEIDRLQKYKVFVTILANEPSELSYEKIKNQRDWWKKIAIELLDKLEPDTGFTDEELGHRDTKNEQA